MNFTHRSLMSSFLALSMLAACSAETGVPAGSEHIEIFDPALIDLIDPQAKWEVLSEGYGWSEGPTWDKAREQLYFTDVPGNKAYVWKDGEGTQVFLDPSGGTITEGFREPGANGLLYLDEGSMLLANHGDRSLQKLNLNDNSRLTLTESFQDKKFNSPNDLVMASNGDVYFSDPPYGLDGLDASPLKELDFNGVYRLSPAGDVSLVTDRLTFPNGVVLSPDNERLYIAQSDPKQAAIFSVDLNAAGPSAPKVFFDMSAYQGDDHPGLPDGFAMTQSGTFFVTGPGGVFVISPEGKALGRILTGSATANCTFGEDGQTLFITAHNRLLRIKTKAKAL